MVDMCVAKSAAISVKAQKSGGDLFHPIGSMQRKAINGSQSLGMGMVTPICRTPDELKGIWYYPSSRSILRKLMGLKLGFAYAIAWSSHWKVWPNFIVWLGVVSIVVRLSLF